MNARRTRWLLPLLVLALVFSLGVAACDNDKDENKTPTATTAAVATTEPTAAATAEATAAATAAATAEATTAASAATQEGSAAGDVGDQLIAAAAKLTGNADNGKALFASEGCVGCHAVEGDTTLVGPSLAKISAVAGSMVAGESAEEYLRISIIHPDAFVVEGFQPNIMPSYADKVDAQQLADLVAYLMTLGA